MSKLIQAAIIITCFNSIIAVILKIPQLPSRFSWFIPLLNKMLIKKSMYDNVTNRWWINYAHMLNGENSHLPPNNIIWSLVSTWMAALLLEGTRYTYENKTVRIIFTWILIISCYTTLVEQWTQSLCRMHDR